MLQGQLQTKDRDDLQIICTLGQCTTVVWSADFWSGDSGQSKSPFAGDQKGKSGTASRTVALLTNGQSLTGHLVSNRKKSVDLPLNVPNPYIAVTITPEYNIRHSSEQEVDHVRTLVVAY